MVGRDGGRRLRRVVLEACRLLTGGVALVVNMAAIGTGAGAFLVVSIGVSGLNEEE